MAVMVTAINLMFGMMDLEGVCSRYGSKLN
jgi:hypothetical protein